MATEAELFDYYGAIPAVFVTAFTTPLAGVLLTTLRTPQTTAEKKTTPRVEIRLSITGSPEHHSLDKQGKEYRDTRSGTVTFRVRVRRDAADQNLGTIVGTILANLRKGKALITAVNLPNYEVTYLEESGGEEADDADNDEIGIDLAADIEFQIKPEKFP